MRRLSLGLIVWLIRTKVTDAGINELKRAFLSLKGTAVTGSGLGHLKGLIELLELDLENSQVTDAN